MVNATKLTSVQLDALKEIGNIGSGNAASALAQFLNRKIDITVPNASMVKFGEISEIVGGPQAEIVGVFLRILGEISGRFLLVIPSDISLKLLNHFMPGSQTTNPTNMTEIEKSCMCEVGNILVGAFLNALSVLTQTTMLNSLPSMCCDMAGALIDSIVAGMASVSDDVLMIETSFIEESEDLRINIFLLLEPQSLHLLLQKIGVA